MISLAIFTVAAVIMYGLVHLLGQAQWSFTPIAVFTVIEMLGTWPSIVAASGSGANPLPVTISLVVAAGGVIAVFAYIVAGGLRPDAFRWRNGNNAPNADQLRQLGAGLVLLVLFLMSVSWYQFSGPPPLLHGGLQALINPSAHSDTVSAIREGRRSLTKGYLVGQAYKGQGVINAVAEAGWQIAVIAATMRHLWGRTRPTLWMMLAVDLLAFVYLASAGKRAPLAIVALGIAGSMALQRRVKVGNVARVGIAVFAFLMFISPLSKGAEAGGSSLLTRQAAVITRITEGNGGNNVAIIRLLDSGVLPPGDGSVFWERLRVIVPGAPGGDPLALTITRLVYGGGDNVTGFSTPTQLGWLYADGKEIGVLLGYGFTGLVMAFVWRMIHRRTSFFAGIVAVYGAILAGYMSVTGVQGLIATGIVATFLFLILATPLLLDRAFRGKKGLTRHGPKGRQAPRTTPKPLPGGRRPARPVGPTVRRT